jgi:hypothetical protein
VANPILITKLVKVNIKNNKLNIKTNNFNLDLNVRHDLNDFSEGQEVILTLADKDVLDDGII